MIYSLFAEMLLEKVPDTMLASIDIVVDDGRVVNSSQIRGTLVFRRRLLMTETRSSLIHYVECRIEFEALYEERCAGQLPGALEGLMPSFNTLTGRPPHLRCCDKNTHKTSAKLRFQVK